MWYKLRMMGIPVIGCSFLYGDNQSVFCNTCILDSTLKKKNHDISYLFIQEEVARIEWVMGYFKSVNNAADTLTKPIIAGERRDGLVGQYIYEL